MTAVGTGISAPARVETTKSIRVLVVDDFKSFRQWVCSKLRKQAHFSVIGEAATAREALRKARRLDPDIILLDVSLPAGSSIALQKELHVVLPSSKIIFLSACDDKEVVRCALGDGAGGYVLKSDAALELASAIKAVNCGKRYVSSAVKLVQ
jgi:DNA-binding NarL/FixJ family response regulator